MFKNYAKDGSHNVCGKQIAKMRLALKPKVSQRALADKLQLVYHVDLDKNAIQQIEAGKRFVTDIELQAFAKLFGVSADDLLQDS